MPALCYGRANNGAHHRYSARPFDLSTRALLKRWHYDRTSPEVLSELRRSNRVRPETGGSHPNCGFMEILHQLGSLIVGSVPTIILFVLLVFAYTLLVRRPLERTLAERRGRTTGAVEQARGAIAAAEAETAVYEDKLRAARAEILAARDHRLREQGVARDRALGSTREQAQSRIGAAKLEIEASAEVARRQIEGAVDELGQRILEVVLPKGSGVNEVRR